MKISYEPKSILYQIAMISFLTPYITQNEPIMHIAFIIAFIALFIWEYTLMKKLGRNISIDLILWTGLYVGLNSYFLYKSINETI